MTRTLEALLITLYALVFETAALAVALPLFVGWDGVPRHLGFAILLAGLGAASVFPVARLALRHGPIRTWQRGCRIGLWAAGGFYLLLIAAFGAVPVLLALPDGDLRDAMAYLATVVRFVAQGSYGLPFIAGALGGALYGQLYGTWAAPRGAPRA